MIVGRAEVGLIVSPELVRVSRPILLPMNSVNQRLPSGPAVISLGSLLGVMPDREFGDGAAGGDPADLVADVLGEPEVAVGPGRDPRGLAVGRDAALNSVMVPPGVIRPILLPAYSVNQRLPSGPAVIPTGPLLGVMPALNSVTVPPVVIRPILLPS